MFLAVNTLGHHIKRFEYFVADGTPFVLLNGVVVYKQTFKHFVNYLDHVAEVLAAFSLTADAATTAETTDFIAQSLVSVLYSVTVIVPRRICSCFLVGILTITQVQRTILDIEFIKLEVLPVRDPVSFFTPTRANLSPTALGVNKEVYAIDDWEAHQLDHVYDQKLQFQHRH